MNRAAAFVSGLLALGAVLLVWAVAAGPGPAADDVDASADLDASASLMVNRAWVQRMPRSKKDIVTWLVPMDLRGKKFGVAQKSSHYWFAGERFTWKRNGKRIQLAFQQSGRTVAIDAKAYKCSKQGFDYCLDLSRGGAKVTMYSKKKWTVPRKGEGTAELPAFDLSALDDPGCEGCTDGLPMVLDDLL